MRLMIKFSFPAESGNAVVASGKIEAIFGKLMEDLKPEAAYFFPVDGERGGVFFVNASDSTNLGVLIEPLWQALNASVEVTPVMSGEDLMQAMPQISALSSRYS